MHCRPCRKAYDGLYIIPMKKVLGLHIILGMAVNVLILKIKNFMKYFKNWS